MLLCRQASMSNHGEEKITPKRRKRRRCIAEESSASKSDWGSAHLDREPESDRGARGWYSEWLSSTTPPSSWHTSGSHMWPAMTPGCARWSWSTTTWIWRSAIRLQRPLAVARLGVRLGMAVVEETARPAISLSLSTSPLAGTLASDGAPTQASNCLTLRICCFLGPESSLLMWLVQVKTKCPQPSHTWI